MEPTTLTVPILVGAALIDSINPCAFGVLIFLLAYLFKTAQKKGRILTHGLVYIFGVFFTYLVAGLVLLPVLQQFGRTAVTLYVAIGILLILFGLLEIKDFFWYGRGPSLSIPPAAARRIEYYTQKVNGKLSVSFFLGIFVALVELPCTGTVYLGVLALVALSGVQIDTLLLLVLYNVIFVLPLLAILFLVSRGTESSRLEGWRKKYRRHMRLVAGLLLVGMGYWMIRLVV